MRPHLNLENLKKSVMKKLILIICIFASINIQASRVPWNTGHGDLEIAKDSSGKGLVIESVAESRIDNISIELNDDAKLIIPNLEQFQFLGEVGAPIWVAPQIDEGNTIFFGYNSNIEPGFLSDKDLTLSFHSSSGPGEFLAWQNGSGGSVKIIADSKDGFNENDSLSMVAPAHGHFNWGFTKPGIYKIGVSASGELASNGQKITSPEEKLHFEISLLKSGEVDIELEYDNEDFELIYLKEETGEEFLPSEAALFASKNAWQKIPENELFSFLGGEGDLVAILPQEENEDLLFLGLASDELEGGVFAGDSVNIQLSSVRGPGDFHLYSVDALSVPSILLSSRDSAKQEYVFGVGKHSHYNWAFSRPGYYEIDLIISGSLQGSDTVVTSDPITMNFEIENPFGDVAILGSGEVDIEVEYEDGTFELILIDEQSETEFESNEVLLKAGRDSWGVIPENESFSFLGNSWDPIAILPQVEDENLLFLGLASDELEAGVFDGDQVEIQLIGLDGPGEFALYSVDTFGAANAILSSVDESLKTLAMPIGDHAHYNWAFTEPGYYEVKLAVSGKLAGTETIISSETIALYFEIEPQFQAILSRGEVDIEVEYEDGTFELVLLDELGGGEYAANNAVFRADASAWQNIPSGSAFAFLGEPGQPIAILPQSEEEGLLFLGLATDELEAGTFEGDKINIKLQELQGPGDFFLYSVDALSNPEIFLNSNNPDQGEFDMPIGQHAHYNWGFTRPGLYKISLVISARLTGSDDILMSESIELNVLVLPPMESLILSISLAEGNVNVGWSTRPGFSYQIQSASSVNSDSWDNVGVIVEGDGEPKSRVYSIGDNELEQLFFRIIQRRLNP